LISEKVSFKCNDIFLEGELLLPGEEGRYPCVIVCHPHPLYGGDMMNNVVTAICRELINKSIAAFRFNFRGVGNSQGNFGGGIAEQEDIKAALDYVLSGQIINIDKIGLAGYSFGGGVTLPVAIQNEQIKILALISPALDDSGWEKLTKDSKPKYVVFGENDTVIPLEGFKRYMKISEPGQYRLITGTDHFWWGYEKELANDVVKFFVDGFS
jgi:alpha/beta superfamily hydrolase